MQKYNKPAVSVRPRRFKGDAQPLQFPLHQFLCMFFRFLVPADDLSAGIEIEGALEGMALGPDQREVPIGVIIVLKKMQFSRIAFVQLPGLSGIPEHIVVAAQQDLTSREVGDIAEILFALRQLMSPAVVAHQHQSVFLPEQYGAVLSELFLVVSPDTLFHLCSRLQFGLKVQMQIPDGIKRHFRSPLCSPNSVGKSGFHRNTMPRLMQVRGGTFCEALQKSEKYVTFLPEVCYTTFSMITTP